MSSIYVFFLLFLGESLRCVVCLLQTQYVKYCLVFVCPLQWGINIANRDAFFFGRNVLAYVTFFTLDLDRGFLA